MGKVHNPLPELAPGQKPLEKQLIPQCWIHCLAFRLSKQAPEQMPMDREMSRTRRSGCNRSSSRKVGSWNRSCQKVPGTASRETHTAMPGAAGLLRQRATLEKSPRKEGRKEGAEHCMEAKRRRHLPGSPARCGLQRRARSRCVTERTNTPAACHIWNPAF